MSAVSLDKKEILWGASVMLLLTLLGSVCDGLVPGRAGLILGDFLPALAAGVLFYLMRVHQHVRMQLAEERVHMMREAIDHIRNAMQIVVYSCPPEAQLAAINRLMQGVDSTLFHAIGQSASARKPH